jgi:hypothetical protein
MEQLQDRFRMLGEMQDKINKQTGQRRKEAE